MTGQLPTVVAKANQSLAPGQRVELFELDLRPLKMPTASLPPGGKMYFSPSSLGETEISFGGKVYASVPMEASGFEINGRGQLPQPLLRVANVNNLAGSLAAAYEDLVGAVLKRTVTFSQFLDGQPMADSGATHPPTLWEVIQKGKQNKLYIEWVMASFLDREGEEIPKRKVWKHTCLWHYREFNPNTGDFDYSNADGCDYAGAAMFDINGNPVTSKAQDVCGQALRDCKLRFGESAELPFGGFLGVNER
jgi:lambda family phage minor tail protein L